MDVQRRRAHLLIALTADSGRLFVRALDAFVLLAAIVSAALLAVVWVGIPLLLLLAAVVRRRADAERARIHDRLHLTLPAPEELSVTGPGHLRLREVARDPAVRHELWWLTYEGTAGILMTALSVAECVTHLALWWLPGPYLLTLHSRCSVRLLAPSGQSLVDRVSELTRWRTRTVDAQAAELRRIERDLHDGAQAQLIALSLHLAVADSFFDTQPATARLMVQEARLLSGAVIDMLRDLVRGVYPPVLLERGLGDAVRALALTVPIVVEVHVELPDRRFSAALESAAYFSVSETLTNAVKHASASRVQVDIALVDGRLCMSVVDDGVGGADPENGSGLAGLAHRLAAFDGALSVHSPDGGPTTILMEVQCESS